MYDTYGTIDFNGENIQDITTRYIIEARTNEYGISMLIEYMIKDWESPENIAYDLYGSCDYAWIILLCNDIVNPFTDWLMTNEEMEEIVSFKKDSEKMMYGVLNYDGNELMAAITGYDLNVSFNMRLINTLTDAESCADALADVFYQALMKQLIAQKPDIAKQQTEEG